MEIRHRDFTTVSLVPFEHQQLFPGEDCRVHVNVDLIIDEQTPVIKVGGTYDEKPAISHQQLPMHHAALVLIDFHSGFQKFLPVILRGLPGRL